MLMRVDLPAPFSPRRQSTSPGMARRSIWSFATTPGNVLVIPTSSTAGVRTPAVGWTGDPGPESMTEDTAAMVSVSSARVDWLLGQQRRDVCLRMSDGHDDRAVK